MKFDEEDLLDLINGPLNGPAKKQKDNEISKNYLPNEINREQDIITVSSKQFFLFSLKMNSDIITPRYKPSAVLNTWDTPIVKGRKGHMWRSMLFCYWNIAWNWTCGYNSAFTIF